MRILLVSKEIYPDDSTGLAIAAKSHYDILKKGYTIRVVLGIKNGFLSQY